MFNVLNKKQLLGKEQLNDFNVKELITLSYTWDPAVTENKDGKDCNVNILKTNIKISSQSRIHPQKYKVTSLPKILKASSH